MLTFYLLVVFLLVTAAAIAWMAPVAPRNAYTVKFELASSVADASPLLGPFGSESWTRMRKTFKRDALFIFGYTGFFVVTGLCVSRLSTRLGWAIVVLAVAVGAADVLENANGLGVLSKELGNASVPLLRRMSRWSQLKWFLLGPLSLAIAWADFTYQVWPWSLASAALFAVAGIIFATSCVAPSLLYRRWPMLVLMGAMIAHTILAFQQRA